MSRFLYAFLFLGLFSLSFADTCIEQASTLKLKEACARTGINCKYGSYCDEKGYCTEWKVAGEACLDSDDCVPGTTCKGVFGSMKCIVNANVGETCNNTIAVETPSCGSQIECIDGVCLGGGYGDACTGTADGLCSFGHNCTAGFCKPSTLGQSCLLSSGCEIGQYCATDLTCKTLPTSGKCSLDSDCAFGYVCIGTSSTDAPQCVLAGTRKEGEYCGSKARACEKLSRCYAGFCSTGKPKFCSDSSECPQDHLCTCNGAPRISGTGSCTKNPCYDLFHTYEECIVTKCKNNQNFDFAKSCLNLNCKAEYDKYVECSPATRVAISIMILIASVITLFI